MNFDKVVSVIVPVHNRSELLVQCLESISQQTYMEIELILIDDASSEDIESVLNIIDFPFSKSPIYIKSKENIGPGSARELGRKIATGNFVCYLDSDDVWHPKIIEKQLEVFHNNSGIGMCYCASEYFNDNTGKHELRPRSNESFESILPIILVTRPWGTGSCLWAKWAIDKIGPWMPAWYQEDIEYDLRAGCLDIPVKNTTEVLCYYRMNSGQQLRDKPQKKILQQILSPQLKMANNIISFNKHKNKFVRKRMILNLFHLGIELLKLDAFVDARKCWNKIWELGRFDINVYLFVIFLNLLSPFLFGRLFIIQFMRLIRLTIIPLNVRKGEFTKELEYPKNKKANI